MLSVREHIRVFICAQLIVHTDPRLDCPRKVKSCNVCTNTHMSILCQSFMYAVGGNDGVASLSSVERFNPHLNKWTEVSEMGQRRAGNGVSKLNGCLYVVGEKNK